MQTVLQLGWCGELYKQNGGRQVDENIKRTGKRDEDILRKVSLVKNTVTLMQKERKKEKLIEYIGKQESNFTSTFLRKDFLHKLIIEGK